ncbi:MAG: hypothetical protein KU38_12500 [Sulfurovum sp. FS08-3]|nr:MAG: hypothetical protein KU38_12500 [Sulfurovum sp. FS08-3]
MDIAKAFEILSQGKIISANSSKYSELANMLLNDSFFEEFKETLNLIGYRLIGEDGYYYIAKKGKLTQGEQQLFIDKNKELILAIALLRQLYPRLDRGGVIHFLQVVSQYVNIQKENGSIKDKLSYFSWNKNKDDEKEILEHFFKYLEKNNILEKESENISDKYRVLNSISYYLSIVESVEKGDNDA